MSPPLLLIDLDDSLVDRRAGFGVWAERFCAEHGLGDAAGWLREIDADGYAPREEFLARIVERFTLEAPVDELLARYRDEYPRCIPPPSAAAFELLAELRARGWKIGVVTNGAHSQGAKLAHTGLAKAVDACCISGVEGFRKPDPRIFRLAAERCGASLDGAWMAGDNPHADIGGAHALGLHTIWFRLGRTWAERGFEPTLAVDSLEEALAHLAQLP
jgi:putative hydrolase of the HAD superfamily